MSYEGSSEGEIVEDAAIAVDVADGGVADAGAEAETETPPPGAGPEPPPEGAYAADEAILEDDAKPRAEIFSEEDPCATPVAGSGDAATTGTGMDDAVTGIAASAGCDTGCDATGAGAAGFTTAVPLPNRPFRISMSDARFPFVAASALSETYHRPAAMPV